MSGPRDERVMKSWRGFSGDVVFRSVPIVDWTEADGAITLRVGDREAAFGFEDRAGGFLDFMIGVALSGAPHVDPRDAHRLAAVLWSLRELEVKQREYTPHERVVEVGELSLGELRGACQRWIDGLLRDPDAHPMAVSYAIEAVEFLGRHLEGDRAGYKRARLEEVTRSEPAGHWRPWSEFLHWMEASTFKRDVTTRSVGRLLVECRVPPGCALRADRERHVRAAGAHFLFEIRRCHLSVSTQQHRADVEGVELVDGEIDYRSGFVFRGHAPVTGRMAGVIANMEGEPAPPVSLATTAKEADGISDFEVELPGRWIVAAFDHERQRLPVPAWNPASPAA